MDLEKYKAMDVLPRMWWAIDFFVCGEGDAWERLKKWFWCIFPLRYQDFPDIHKERIKEIFNDIWDISKFKLSSIDKYILEKQWTSSIYFRKIKNKTASKYIKQLYKIYLELLDLKNN